MGSGRWWGLVRVYDWLFALVRRIRVFGYLVRFADVRVFTVRFRIERIARVIPWQG